MSQTIKGSVGLTLKRGAHLWYMPTTCPRYSTEAALNNSPSLLTGLPHHHIHSCEVTAEIGRNADNRLRVLGLDVALKLGVPAAQLEHLDRVLVQFESFCTVGASVAQGSCEVTAEIGRNADNRLRVLGLDVALKLGVPAAHNLLFAMKSPQQSISVTC
ncbi:hypothetical protein [Mycobacterium tuberculosis]|uniref:hypothetical protein n=1 Tax=Mycobacterium tuberculosis TaxID=1773 RepID=UPI00272CB4A1|nr:hypothetical protein [Mycobacterium tuberculosis]